MYQLYENTRSSITAWAANFEPISETEMELYLKASTDRGNDNWIALGIIAKRISNEWVHGVQASLDAVEARQSDDMQSTGVQLLSNVCNIVA